MSLHNNAMLGIFSGGKTGMETPQAKIVSNEIPNDIGSIELGTQQGREFDRFDKNKDTSNTTARIRTYREMQSDPTIGGSLQGYENILSLVKLKLERVSLDQSGLTKDEYNETKAEDARRFTQSCADDMRGTHMEDVLASALDFLAIGYAVQVPNYKVRAGSNDDARFDSKYNDGRIGWKNFKTIRQESIERWLVRDGDGYEDLTGLQQVTINGEYINIPRNRMLLYRTSSKGGRIESESLLFAAARTYRRLKGIKDIENVSLSRNLEGIPVLRIDQRYLNKNATPEEKAFLQYMIKQVKSVKYNEQVAIVLPSNLDKETKAPLIDITLMTAAPNARVDQCRTIITADESLMAQSLLANFLKVDGTGSSNATSSSLQDLFILAMKKYVQIILNVINDEAIVSLMKINGMDTVYAPRYTYEGLDTDSLGVFIDALMKSVQAGVVIPTKSLQNDVLSRMNINTAEADAAFDKTEALQDELFKLQKEGMKPEGPGSGGNQQKGGTELNPEKLSKAKGTEVELFEAENGKIYYMKDGQPVLLEE